LVFDYIKHFIIVKTYKGTFTVIFTQYLSIIFPEIPYFKKFFKHYTFTSTWREFLFENSLNNSKTYVEFIHGIPSYASNDLEVVKKVLISPGPKEFDKPIEVYQLLELFGPNLVTVNKDKWMSLKKSLDPVFSIPKHLTFIKEITLKYLDFLLKIIDEKKRI